MLYGVIEFSVGVIIAVPIIASLCTLYSSTSHSQQAPYNDEGFEYDESYEYRRNWRKSYWDEDVILSRLDYPMRSNQRSRKHVRIVVGGKTRNAPVRTYQYWSYEPTAGDNSGHSDDLARSIAASQIAILTNLERKEHDINQQTVFLGEALLEPGKVRVRWICVSRCPV
jgi:hypothetical protein